MHTLVSNGHRALGTINSLATEFIAGRGSEESNESFLSLLNTIDSCHFESKNKSLQLLYSFSLCWRLSYCRVNAHKVAFHLRPFLGLARVTSIPRPTCSLDRFTFTCQSSARMAGMSGMSPAM